VDGGLIEGRVVPFLIEINLAVVGPVFAHGPSTQQSASCSLMLLSARHLHCGPNTALVVRQVGEAGDDESMVEASL
jgi:hypothetical protein